MTNQDDAFDSREAQRDADEGQRQIQVARAWLEQRSTFISDEVAPAAMTIYKGYLKAGFTTGQAFQLTGIWVEAATTDDYTS